MKKLVVCTMVANFFIVIGAGHGIGILGMLLVYPFNFFTSNDFSFSLSRSFDESLGAAILFSVLGHILLLTSILQKRGRTQGAIQIGAILLLWISFYYLTHTIFQDPLAKLSFLTGLPFLFISTLLFVKSVRQIKCG